MRYRIIWTAFLITILTTMASVSQAEEKAKQSTSSTYSDGRVKHVFVIMLENHSAASVIGDKHNPYITSLAQHYASASKYYGVTHPSLPNYVALISGSNWFVNNDDENNRFSHTNLVDQLEAAQKTWAGYMEALPRNNKLIDFWPNSNTKLYASKHNPFVLFDNIRKDQARLTHVKPYTDLAADLENEKTTPNFALIVPDQCNDMHGGVTTYVPGHPETPCPYGTDNDKGGLKEKADTFVKSAITQIMSSMAWKHTKSVIFIIADEGDENNKPAPNGGGDSPDGCCDSPIVPRGAPGIKSDWPGGIYGGGLVPAIVIVSKGGKSHGYMSSTSYNHYSLLATIESIWHLGLLGYASDTVQVKPMTEFLNK
jgi:hypothetical protein